MTFPAPIFMKHGKLSDKLVTISTAHPAGTEACSLVTSYQY
jgi:hypothetical protein